MPSVFEYPVAYVENLSSFPAAVARAAGVKGLAIKLQDAWGNPACEANYEALFNGQAAALRTQGFVVGAWSCPREEPEHSADDTSAIYKALNLSFAVFETEIQYKTDGGGIDVARLLNEWRKYRPKAYTGFAVEGGPPDTFNHAALIADPLTFLCPENYWRQDAQYEVARSLARAEALGWPLERVKPTLTGVEGHSLAEAIIRLYRAHAEDPAVLWGEGYLLWRGDMLSDADYALVKLADTLALR